jgi:hypothetical protein
MDPIEVHLEYKNSTKQFTEWLLKTSTLKGTVNTVNSWPAHANNIVRMPQIFSNTNFL